MDYLMRLQSAKGLNSLLSRSVDPSRVRFTFQINDLNDPIGNAIRTSQKVLADALIWDHGRCNAKEVEQTFVLCGLNYEYLLIYQVVYSLQQVLANSIAASRIFPSVAA